MLFLLSSRYGNGGYSPRRFVSYMIRLSGSYNRDNGLNTVSARTELKLMTGERGTNTSQID